MISGYSLLSDITKLNWVILERHLVLRIAAPFQNETSLQSVDHAAASNSATTAWMAHSWSGKGGRFGLEFAIKLMQVLVAYRQLVFTDLRI